MMCVSCVSQCVSQYRSADYSRCVHVCMCLRLACVACDAKPQRRNGSSGRISVLSAVLSAVMHHKIGETNTIWQGL